METSPSYATLSELQRKDPFLNLGSTFTLKSRIADCSSIRLPTFVYKPESSMNGNMITKTPSKISVRTRKKRCSIRASLSATALMGSTSQTSSLLDQVLGDLNGLRFYEVSPTDVDNAASLLTLPSYRSSHFAPIHTSMSLPWLNYVSGGGDGADYALEEPSLSDEKQPVSRLMNSFLSLEDNSVYSLYEHEYNSNMDLRIPFSKGNHCSNDSICSICNAKATKEAGEAENVIAYSNINYDSSCNIKMDLNGNSHYIDNKMNSSNSPSSKGITRRNSKCLTSKQLSNTVYPLIESPSTLNATLPNLNFPDALESTLISSVGERKTDDTDFVIPLPALPRHPSHSSSLSASLSPPSPSSSRGRSSSCCSSSLVYACSSRCSSSLDNTSPLSASVTAEIADDYRTCYVSSSSSSSSSSPPHIMAPNNPSKLANELRSSSLLSTSSTPPTSPIVITSLSDTGTPCFVPAFPPPICSSIDRAIVALWHATAQASFGPPAANGSTGGRSTEGVGSNDGGSSSSSSSSSNNISDPHSKSNLCLDSNQNPNTSPNQNQNQNLPPQGLLRYDVSRCESRMVPGGLGLIAQLNEGRANLKRPTEFRVDRVLQDFDPSKFNFEKAGVNEVFFGFQEEGVDGGEGRKEEERSKASLGSSADLSSLALVSAETKDYSSSHLAAHTSSPNLVLLNVSPIEFGHILLVPRVLDRLPQRLTKDTLRSALRFAVASGNPRFRVGFNSLGGYATVNHLHFQAYFLDLPLACEGLREGVAWTLEVEEGLRGEEEGGEKEKERQKQQQQQDDDNGDDDDDESINTSVAAFPSPVLSPLPISTSPTPPFEIGLSVIAGDQYPVRGFVLSIRENRPESVEAPSSSPPIDAALTALAAVTARACEVMQARDIAHNILICEAGRKVFLWPQCFAKRLAKGEVPEHVMATGVNPAAFEIAGHLLLKRRGDFEAVGTVGEALGAGSDGDRGEGEGEGEGEGRSGQARVGEQLAVDILKAASLGEEEFRELEEACFRGRARTAGGGIGGRKEEREEGRERTTIREGGRSCLTT